MDITNKHRSHWVAKDGTRYATLMDATGRNRVDVQPVLNLDELRDYVAIGKIHLPYNPSVPDGSASSVFYVKQLLDHPKELSRNTIAAICAELTDYTPMYSLKWRAPFLAMREKYPAVGQ